MYKEEINEEYLMFNLKSIKTQLIIFLLYFAVLLSLKDKDFAFLFTTLIAVISAVVIDTLIVYLKQKRLLISESSIISGLIVGFVLSSDQPWWVFLLASLLGYQAQNI